MDEKQFKIMIEKLDKMIVLLEKIQSKTVDINAQLQMQAIDKRQERY